MTAPVPGRRGMADAVRASKPWVIGDPDVWCDKDWRGIIYCCRTCTIQMVVARRILNERQSAS